jgi:hypothetical protein
MRSVFDCLAFDLDYDWVGNVLHTVKMALFGFFQ